MREILFRGKRIDNQKWVYGFLIMNKYAVKENGKLIYITKPDIIPIGEIGEADYDGDGNYYEYTVIPETVGQYTGLKDRNGINIFEGDVVTAPYIDPIFHSAWNEGNLTENTVVKYADGMFYIEYVESKQKITLFGLLNGAKEAEVIGNIYDNPELLKGAEQ